MEQFRHLHLAKGMTGSCHTTTFARMHASTAHDQASLLVPLYHPYSPEISQDAARARATEQLGLRLGERQERGQRGLDVSCVREPLDILGPEGALSSVSEKLNYRLVTGWCSLGRPCSKPGLHVKASSHPWAPERMKPAARAWTPSPCRDTLHLDFATFHNAWSQQVGV